MVISIMFWSFVMKEIFSPYNVLLWSLTVSRCLPQFGSFPVMLLYYLLLLHYLPSRWPQGEELLPQPPGNDLPYFSLINRTPPLLAYQHFQNIPFFFLYCCITVLDGSSFSLQCLWSLRWGSIPLFLSFHVDVLLTKTYIYCIIVFCFFLKYSNQFCFCSQVFYSL